MKKEAFCRWHDKPLRDVTEVQQEQCEENGQQCDGCPNLILRKKEQREMTDSIEEQPTLKDMADCEGAE